MIETPLLMGQRLLLKVFWMGCAVTLLWGCSSTKHVPEGEYLVDKVSVKVEDSKSVSSSDLYNYLRQIPNHRVLGFFKLQLATYSLSGMDSTKWYNRWLHKLGQAPVIYDRQLTEASASQLRQAMINKGYLGASVEVDTIKHPKKRKINVSYTVHAGIPHTISSISYNIPDSSVQRLVMRDSMRFSVKLGDLLDRNNLDAERALITERLRNRGYYTFNKEYITYTADTVAGSTKVDLTMNLRMPVVTLDGKTDTLTHHEVYFIRNVIFVTNYESRENADDYDFKAKDTVRYKDVTILYGNDRYLTPQALEEKCFIVPGGRYNTSQIDRTYEALSQLGILQYINVDLKPLGNIDDKMWLDAYILLSCGKKQGISVEVEGTNSEGDLGFGLGVTYQHRNLAKGSELLTAKIRTAYESLSGNLDGFINNHYIEFAGEVGITFPKFKGPLSKRFKQRMQASSEFAVSFNYQERPEYTRIIAGAAWKYKWGKRGNTERHTYDFIDINYVYLPKSTIDFIEQITNPLLRYSYEDHFIMRTGYSYYRTNRRVTSSSTMQRYSSRPSVYTFRVAVETAGNLLYALSSLFNQKRSDGIYKIFGIQYSQYAKADFDYTYTWNFDLRNSMAFHVGGGIGVPYANSSMIPFEKRFYAGGANGVRGWGVRTLGPGSYDSKNSVDDFINQCGDIRLDLSMEYRAKLFWVLEGALFIDAGNIWTIHNYENQPGGMFHFNSFYKDIALAYGAGIRLDFTYFLLRFDLGMKAHNPAQNQERWPLVNPKWGRDATFHFAVGYPF